MTAGFHDATPPGCRRHESEALPHLYGEQPPGRRTEYEGHLRSCGVCRDEVASLAGTLRLIEEAALDRTATESSPGDWEAIEHRLRAAPAAPGTGLRPRVWLARAAVLLLVAGASFVAGRWWDVLSPGLGLSSAGPSDSGPSGPRTDAGDTGSRLARFSRETNDYLARSRLVLLEFSNADGALESGALREASRVLLRENRRARSVAEGMDDRRLEDLVAALEGILREISFPPEPADAAVRDRIKAQLNSSGVLDQLEILSMPRSTLAAERTRT